MGSGLDLAKFSLLVPFCAPPPGASAARPSDKMAQAPPKHLRRAKKVPDYIIRNAIKTETRRQLLKNKFDQRDFQLDASVSIACGRDTVLIAPTGAGKTLVLAMPLLYHTAKTSLVISPLHALETDQVKKMNAMGIPSLMIDTIDLPDKEYRVRSSLLYSTQYDRRVVLIVFNQFRRS